MAVELEWRVPDTDALGVGLGDPEEETDVEAVVLGVPLAVSEGVAGINKRVVLGVAVTLGVPVLVGV